MGVKHTHIVRYLSQSQVHSPEKDYPGHLIKRRKKSKNLETIIGRLNHTALIIALARHFLARIKFFHSNTNAVAWYQLQPKIRDNLKLHMKILQKAHKGISMNLPAYCEPTRICHTDYCEIGMGGLSSKGRA